MKSSESSVQDRCLFGRFRPHLRYDERLCCLQVLLRDSRTREVVVSKQFDILKDIHPKKKQGVIAGFNLWGVKGMLYEQEYFRSSIALEHLIKRFDRFHKMPYELRVPISSFGVFRKVE